MFQGAVEKRYVIKHYHYAIIKTKFPGMTGIIASPGQGNCRNLFREAVSYGKTVIADREKKKARQKRLKRRNGVYNEAVKYYMLKEKLAKQRAELLTSQLISQAFKNEPPAITTLAVAHICTAKKIRQVLYCRSPVSPCLPL